MWSSHSVLRHMTRRLVCKLKKALYGLKQEPRTWYGRIDGFLSSLGFTKSKEDSNLYYKVEDGNPVILLLYVGDLFVTGMDGLIADSKRKLVVEFEMKDLGMMHYFLGMVECGWNPPRTRELCSRDPEEVWDDGVQGYGHTYGIEPEYIE